MELAVAADVAIDLATKDDLDQHHQNIRKMFEKPAGRYYKVHGSGTIPSGGIVAGGASFAFTPPSPPADRLWFIQWLSLFVGTSPFAATANLNAAFCIGRSPVGGGGGMPPSILINVADIVIPGLTMPSSQGLPDKTVVTSQEQAYVLLSGSGLGGAGTVYNGIIGVLDVPDTEEVFFW